MLTYDDPLTKLRPVHPFFILRPLHQKGLKASVGRSLISVCEYILASAAILNVLHLGWTLGLQAVVA